jgi:hypothetical protein
MLVRGWLGCGPKPKEHENAAEKKRAKIQSGGTRDGNAYPN